MNYRIQQFLAAENITQAQLADTLGVARASVSHIIAGRNRPGFDFIESMARNYPTLNLDWLITGRGRMYKDAAAAPAQTVSPLPEAPVSPAESIFDEPEDGLFASLKPAVEPVKPAAPSQPSPATAAPQSPQMPQNRPQPAPAVHRSRGIAKILVLFEDGSFQELK